MHGSLSPIKNAHCLTTIRGYDMFIHVSSYAVQKQSSGMADARMLAVPSAFTKRKVNKEDGKNHIPTQVSRMSEFNIKPENPVESV